MTEIKSIQTNAYVITQQDSAELIETQQTNAYIITQQDSAELIESQQTNAYVISTTDNINELSQFDSAKEPQYVVSNGTPYVDFGQYWTTRPFNFSPDPNLPLAVRDIPAVRYWRFNSSKGSRTRFAELTFQDENGVEISTPYTTQSSTVYNSSFAGPNAFDGTDAGWISDGGDAWVGKFFATGEIVKQYSLKSYVSANFTNENPSSWTIEFSEDGENWFVAHTVDLGRNMNDSEIYNSGLISTTAEHTLATYQVIALKPNLTDFFETTLVGNSPINPTNLQNTLNIPHFNQLFMTPRTLTTQQRTNIKDRMISDAVGGGATVTDPTDAPINVPSSGLILMLDATSSYIGGNNWVDISSSSQTVTPSATAATYNSSPPRFTFNGSNNYFDTGFALNQTSGNQYTAVTICRRDASNPSGRRWVVGTDNSGFDWQLGQDGSYGMFTGSGVLTTGNTTTDWVMLTGVWDGIGNTTEVFINTVSSVTGSIDFDTSYNNVSIGRNPGFGEYWYGDVGVVLIYDRLLTSQEQSDIYNTYAVTYGLP